MAWRTFGQIVALALSIAVAIWLAELWLFAGVALGEGFSTRPLATIAGLLLFLGFVFLCIAGSRMRMRAAIYYVARAILLLLSAAVAVVSAELILTATITLASGFENADWQDYLSALSGLVLVALAAAGIRYVFDWSVAYWIVFAALLGVIIVAILAIQLGIVFS